MGAHTRPEARAGAGYSATSAVAMSVCARHLGKPLNKYRPGRGRTTLYRATIEDNRHRAATSGTLAGLTDEIATLRGALETLATSVGRHEEQLRKLTSREG